MKKVEVKVPSTGESVSDADLTKWYKNDGDIVQMDEPLLELETEKASEQVTAEISGRLKIQVEAGETVDVGQVLGTIEEVDESELEKAKEESKGQEKKEEKKKEAKKEEKERKGKEAKEKEGEEEKREAVAAPAAERLMAEHNIQAGKIEGTGREGRITKGDVLEYLDKQQETKETAKEEKEAPSKEVSSPEPVSEKIERSERVEKMSRLRRTIAKRLVNAQQSAALLTTFNEVDMQPVMDIRKQYKEEFKEKKATGLGLMSFFTKAAAQALMDFPIVNAKVDEENIIYHNYADIGIAVATERGLVVPILRNAHRMSFAEIEKKISQLAKQAREGKLGKEELSGGTFSITNGGVFGSMLSTPIVNYPQSAILGMHNVVERPIAINGEVVIRPIMYVALSYDHRIIDGADSVRFLKRIKQLLEEPMRLMLEL